MCLAVNVAKLQFDAAPISGLDCTRCSALRYVADAESHGIYTMLTLVYCPDNAFFRGVQSRVPQTPEWAENWNSQFMTARGHACYVAYGSALAAGLKARLLPAAQSALLISLQNEFFLQGSQYPFSSRSGNVKFADGIVYDMANATSRQQGADANTNLWAERLRTSIRRELPSALVTVGVFTFKAVQKQGSNGLLLDGLVLAGAFASCARL